MAQVKRKPHKLTPAARQRRRLRKMEKKGHIRIHDGESIASVVTRSSGWPRKG